MRSSTTARRPRRTSRTPPGLKVVACSNPADAYWMIQQAIALRRPGRVLRAEAAVLRGQGRGRRDRDAGRRCFSSRVVRQGTDATLVAYGPMVAVVLQSAEAAAAERPRARGHRPALALAARHWTPVFASVRRTGRLVVVHEAPVSLGLGAEIAARVTRSASTPWRRRCCGSAATTPRTRRPHRGGVPARPRPRARRRRPLAERSDRRTPPPWPRL